MHPLRAVYTGLFYALTPFVLGRLLWRARRAPAYALRWSERFARYGGPARQGVIWVHAVSVGEAEAAFPLIRGLLESQPDVPLLVTTTTPTGSARVREVLGDTVLHVYLPYDLPDCIERFLNRFRPRLGVVVETEIWPNLFSACARRAIPLAIVNARLSRKSARGYAKLAPLARSSLEAVRWVGAQSEADADRYRSIGARPERVEVSGNIKFDLQLPQSLSSDARTLRAALFGQRPVLIAGSTHEGEEEVLLRVLAQVRKRRPELLLVLAPRHPERFGAVARLCEGQGLHLARHSEATDTQRADVFLLDAMGQLRLFYAAADMAFVGGSLVPTGGHNSLEPAAAGIPVVLGPHTFNFEELTRKLVEAGGAVRVADGDGLARQVLAWLDDESLRHQAGRRGLAFVEAGRGALERTARALAGLLEPGGEGTAPRVGL